MLLFAEGVPTLEMCILRALLFLLGEVMVAFTNDQEEQYPQPSQECICAFQQGWKQSITHTPRLVSNSQRSSCLCLPSTGIKETYRTTLHSESTHFNSSPRLETSAAMTNHPNTRCTLLCLSEEPGQSTEGFAQRALGGWRPSKERGRAPGPF